MILYLETNRIQSIVFAIFVFVLDTVWSGYLVVPTRFTVGVSDIQNIVISRLNSK